MTTDADWARRQLVVIDDELRELASDDFARRHSLQAAADGFRAVMREGNADALAAARAEWNTRAGRKGGHAVDYDALAEVIRSYMPGAGTGSA